MDGGDIFAYHIASTPQVSLVYAGNRESAVRTRDVYETLLSWNITCEDLGVLE
jgi:hypothetical protein